MKKTLFIILASLLLLTACGTKDGKDKDSERLIIYSNSATEGRGDWITGKAEEAGFDIEVVEIPGGDLSNRLIAEKNNKIADMIFGLNTIEYEKLKNEDMLVEYRPTWADEVDTDLGDNKYYYPIVTQPLVFIYNGDLLSGDKKPTDMMDFIKPEFKDQYNLFANSGGTGRTVLSGLLVRYADEAGELGISEEGWEVAKKYVQNGHFEIKGEDYVGNVISGERPISMLWGSGVLQNQAERDHEFDIMQPEIGVPFVVEQTAIVNEDKVELATEFINWFGSSDIQAAWSAEFGTIPAHPVALEQASQDVKDFMAKVKSQDMDWELVSEYVDQWVEKVELEFIQ